MMFHSLFLITVSILIASLIAQSLKT